MRILVLAPQWPDPPRQGAAIRNLHILLYLAQRHDVTLLTFEPQDGDISKSRLEAACERAEALPLPTRSRQERLRTLISSPLPDMAWRLHSEAMRERVRDLCAQTPFDAVHIEGIEMAPYAFLAAGVQGPRSRNEGWGYQSKIQNPKSKITYDAHNAEYLLQRRAFTTDARHPRRWPRAIYSLVQWWRLRRFERQLCLLSDHVLAVSAPDRAALARLAPSVARRIRVLPNGVDTAYWSLAADYDRSGVRLPPNALVFDGTMDFRPNLDAVLWFASEVWPLVLAERPDARFYIVGRNPAPEVTALAREPGIAVTGSVDDPRLWVGGASVYVVPMRMGGGVRLKVLQAMSMERAIVSTPMGAEGIDVEPGKEMLIAASAQAFAKATLSLLSDSERRLALGKPARNLAITRYAWPILLPTLDSIYPPEG